MSAWSHVACICKMLLALGDWTQVLSLACACGRCAWDVAISVATMQSTSFSVVDYL